jgi:LPXTG-site transpeptidase (sortase) family protein
MTDPVPGRSLQWSIGGRVGLGRDEGCGGMRRCMVVLLAIAALMVAAPAEARPQETEGRTAVQLGRLTIPAIGVNAGIIPVGVTKAGHLAIGGSVRDVYRWRDGVLPGQQGSAVLAGHTWSRGPGVFDNLGRLRPGNRVIVGKNRFKVTRVRRVTGLSREAVAALFSDRGKPRLVLITCGDRNNLTGVYRTRIIVNAKKLPSR